IRKAVITLTLAMPPRLQCLFLPLMLLSVAGGNAKADRSVSYATYFGGDSIDSIASTAEDPAGNLYVTGYTYSSNLPVTPGAFQLTHGGVPGTVFSIFESPPQPDAFVAKFSSSGMLVWATYLGGKGSDMGQAIAVDAQGNVIIAGSTSSADFPVTAGALDVTLPCSRAIGSLSPS
ncbi:MAG TPA: SBBP repeat-containing protein, partial [Bryobacteraceae bacterium]|nr:SBBP repeat-containing protein [Bryobacteraceae bacterium]